VQRSPVVQEARRPHSATLKYFGVSNFAQYWEVNLASP
jgi:hypothetical protein